MTGVPVVRTMQPADVTQAVGVIAAHSKEDARLAERYFRKYFADEARVAAPREGSLVAVVDGDVVGVVTYGPDKYDWPGILWMEWLYVHPAHRRKGIGNTLMQHVLDAARTLETRKLYLNTDSAPSYEAAVRLYQRFGFQEEGRFLDYYGRGYHSIIMGLVM